MEIPYHIVAQYKDISPAYERVYVTLKECIERHYVDSASKITEVGISRALGVSRTPVRIAMNMLKSDGLLHSVSKSALAVAKFSRKDRADLLALSELLEGRAAWLAAQRAKPHDIAILRDLNSQRESFLRNKPSEEDDCVRDIHLQMHQLVAKMSGNSFLYREIAELRSLMRLFKADGTTWQNRIAAPAETVHELTYSHAQIINALEAKDSDTAELWTKIDIRKTAALYINHKRLSPDHTN